MVRLIRALRRAVGLMAWGYGAVTVKDEEPGLDLHTFTFG